jgi:hypothetical protein
LDGVRLANARIVLRRAYTLVLRGWCRGHLAVDADGTPSGRRHASAPVAWSLLGAVKTGDLAGHDAALILRKLVGSVDLQDWNDDALRKKRDVLDLLSLAITNSGGRAPRRGGWHVGAPKK